MRKNKLYNLKLIRKNGFWNVKEFLANSSLLLKVVPKSGDNTLKAANNTNNKLVKLFQVLDKILKIFVIIYKKYWTKLS
jgi:hypothetical protein